ncbi:TetR/AcrR family transcriptional regulator [Granulosicoccus sp. 3-233]|uniref:TetR/AcrR family transcriptional regulator n=1 Tax=Granulosicoccus sp. 3-233 TaxID=3417969 RepID=UPI003D333144
MNDNRSRLLEIAEGSVQRTGLKALSFRTLADEVGIKSSSVHYHFPEKADLARTLIEQYRDRLFLELESIAASDAPLRNRILAFVDVFARVAQEDRICLLCMMASEFAVLNADNQALLANVFTNLENWLAQLLENNRASLTTELSSLEIARLAITGLEGALLVDRVMRNSDRLNAQKTALLQLVKLPLTEATVC